MYCSKTIISLSLLFFLTPLVAFSQAATSEESLLSLVASGGKEATCLYFDGDNDYVDCGYGESLQIDEEVTVEAWIQPEVHSPWQRIVAAPASFDPSYCLALGGYDNSIAAGIIYRDGRQIRAQTAANVITPGRWNHVAMTLDGTELNLYVNGERRILFDVEPWRIFGNSLWIGRRQDHKYAFCGLISEVRIWDQARAQEQIERDMGVRLSGPKAGLVALWHFDEGAGQIAQDASGQGNHGQLGDSAIIDFSDPFWEEGKSPFNASARWQEALGEAIESGNDGLQQVTPTAEYKDSRAKKWPRIDIGGSIEVEGFYGSGFCGDRYSGVATRIQVEATSGNFGATVATRRDKRW